MLVNKITKEVQTRSDNPRTNWLGNEWYCVDDDNVELTQKIRELTPRFDFVVENGELVDVVEIPKTEEELNLERIAEIDRELEDIDKTTGINRVIEDLITLTGMYNSMYGTTKDIINKKIELREERKQLVEQLAVLTNEDNLSTETEVGEIIEEAHENL